MSPPLNEYDLITNDKLGKPVKKLPEEVSVPASGPASNLYKQIALKANISIHRLRVTKGSDGALVPNSNDLSLSSTGLRDQSTIYVKDLGMFKDTRSVQNLLLKSLD